MKRSNDKMRRRGKKSEDGNEEEAPLVSGMKTRQW
jgi:hypothetical protein